MANGCTIDYVEQCVHLGTIIHSDITRKNMDSAVNDLFMRTNNLIADFSYTHSSTLSVLFQSYCMNVYGSQLWSYNDLRAVKDFTRHGEKLFEGFGVFIKEHIMLLITVYQLVYY